MKKFGWIMSAALACPLLLAAAQSTPGTSPNDGKLPVIRVGGLSLDKTEYSVGETVKGQVTLTNDSDGGSGEIKYLVSLVELDPLGHAPVAIYGREQSKLFELPGKSQKEIEFSYPINSAPADGRLGLHLRVAIQDGLPLAQAVQDIRVTGGTTMARLLDGFILVNEQHKYGLQESPRVGEGDTVSLVWTMSNPTGERMELCPRVMLLDRARNTVNENPSMTAKPVAVKAGGNEKINVELPIEGLKPQTYLAETYFTNKEGKQCSSYYYAWFEVR